MTVTLVIIEKVQNGFTITERSAGSRDIIHVARNVWEISDILDKIYGTPQEPVPAFAPPAVPGTIQPVEDEDPMVRKAIDQA